MQAQNTLEASSSEVLGDLQVYSMDEVCALLRVSRPLVKKEVRNGKLNARRISNGKQVFTAEDIRKYIASLPHWKDATSASQLQSPDVTE
jgi:excisionase family DNA binding protein|tara:strand:+ start:523 stop:792 length:270 start_codon:yes stop_codon:yes gene_type:complete